MLALKIIIFFAALVIAVVIGERLKINAGILAIAFAFLIGITLAGVNVSGIIALFPVRVFYNLFIATLFYGFANENGTMTVLTRKLVYFFRNAQWAMPLVLFLIAAIISAAGANLEATVLLLSPLGFSLALEMGFNPFLVAVGTWAGGCLGNWVPWGSFTNTFAAMFYDLVGEEAAHAAFNRMLVVVGLLLIIIVILMFFIYKGYKAKGSADIHDVETSSVNRKTLIVMGISLIVIIIPAFIQIIAPNPVTKWLAVNFGIQSVAAISSAIMAIMKLADVGTVIKNRVPWNMIVMICGVTMLMGLLTPLGITDALGAFLAESGMSAFVTVPLLCAIFALLSFFVSGMVLQPLLVSLAPALMGIGISVATIVTAAQAGGILSSLSPYSAAGAMAISGCPEEKRVEIAGKMIRYAIIFSVIASLLGFTGLYSIGG